MEKWVIKLEIKDFKNLCQSLSIKLETKDLNIKLETKDLKEILPQTDNVDILGHLVALEKNLKTMCPHSPPGQIGLSLQPCNFHAIK